MKIELKSIRFYERLSEETNAFTANLYIDGVMVGTAKNDGQGGPTFYQASTKENRVVLEKAEEYCKSLPDKVYPASEKMESFSVKMDLEGVIDDLLTDYLVSKDRKKLVKKLQKKMLNTILWGDDSSWREITFKGKPPLAQITSTPKGIEAVKKVIADMKMKYPEDRLLNTNLQSIL